MEILLIENVRNLGVRGDIVNVKDGYARNYLLPCNKALLVTSSNKYFIEQEKERNRKIRAKELADALLLAAKLEAVSPLTIAKKAGSKGGALFGSVTNGDIATLLKTKGFDIEKQSIVLPHVKTVGTYDIDVRLYSGVHAKLQIEVTAIATE
jgi:large subunit ribosomal protein L9